jgi:PilS N terminal
MKPQQQRRQRGASLLEASAFLCIATIVIAGATALISQAFLYAGSNAVLQETFVLRQNTRKLILMQRASYGTADLTAELLAAKALPATLTIDKTTGNAKNTWGGAVTIKGSNGGKTFTVGYGKVPADFCINVVSGASGWKQIDPGAGGEERAITQFPVKPEDAVAMCSAKENTLNFTSE